MKMKATARNEFRDQVMFHVERRLQDIEIDLQLVDMGGEGGRASFTTDQLQKIQAEWLKRGIIR